MTIGELRRSGREILTFSQNDDSSADSGFSRTLALDVDVFSKVATVINTSNFVLSATPALDVDVILCHILNISKTYLLTHDDLSISNDVTAIFIDAMLKRRTGLPVAYITGHKEFFGIDFFVSPDVLIPKPDTELLVEKAIEECEKLIAKKAQLQKRISKLCIADICTGSGCIGISLLKTLKYHDIELFMTDISAKALEIAKENSRRIIVNSLNECSSESVIEDEEKLNDESIVKVKTKADVESKAKISFFKGDLCEPLLSYTNYFDIVMSNPPYVPCSITNELLKDGRSEPRLALDGDADDKDSTDGLSLIKRLIPQVFSILKPGGIFFVESGEYNAKSTSEYLSKAGFIDILIHKDMAGQLRMTEAHKPL